MNNLSPFHLAIPVQEITTTRDFYRDVLGCKEGRSSDHCKKNIDSENIVDGKNVPVPHFGIVLDWQMFTQIEKRIKNKVEFIIKPYVRFKGERGEQKTMFFKDPSGNALEFKSFKNINQLFEK